MKRIFLIGYMGAGKTTVGKELANRMKLSFVDLDHYIEARYHKTVRDLFAEKGEDAFRDMERNMLHEVATFEDVIISTGGGAPCFFDNMSFMNQIGTTVYLKVSAEELSKRLELVKHTRPILKGKAGEELTRFVKDNLEVRTPWYTQASIIYDAEVMLTDRDVEDIAEALANILL
ncbi:shikimate kinase [Parabacteroides sp. PF5-5]|uniref:shikimate kinase n=1 Tax=unclassified Parabacteroides TaxID=2649774 RepID=UPI002475BCD5|nr:MULTISPECIES: shikimate kinase [unclassified Parabacteroides]MDH6305993.1 shikimate kinase [Parabacteroides sp. PH5-39]MDH6317249.1 shikimate kinase [Parabacteroides sp. PF5-13]MDH6320705.1 shikimate kinase [Parabacteroides sp. PH5-13]MDH6324374.1 shikimate kinase [Parabacteroides sp. PH5-8]MDH6328434.1 shikimate kinase [Parabacteroides sp. PH5-41]